MTQIGIVGAGRWGRVLAPALRQHADVPVYAAAGSEANAALMAAACPGIRRVSYGEILQDPSIDAIAIATPTMTHVSLALAALSAGKHVFLEKPMADTRASADLLVNAAQRTGRRLFVGFKFVYHPLWTFLKAVALADGIGSIAFEWRKFGTFDEDLLWTLTCHQLALTMDLFGEMPLSFSVLERTTDTVVLALQMADGVTCSIRTDRRADERSHYVSLVTPRGNRCRLDFNSDDPSGPSMLHRECEEFVKVVRTGQPTRTDATLGHDVVTLTEAVRAVRG